MALALDASGLLKSSSSSSLQGVSSCRRSGSCALAIITGLTGPSSVLPSCCGLKMRIPAAVVVPTGENFPRSRFSVKVLCQQQPAAPPAGAAVSEDAIGIWRNADAVCFDVDSTVCLDEGIDALGEFCGAGEAVAAWTSRAMGGDVPFEVALAARLSLFTPSLADVQKFLASNPPKITPGIEELFDKLQKKGKDVYLISGGFRQMIAPVARILKVPDERIFANKLLFDDEGKYAGFDPAEPTARSGGKAAAIAQIKQNFCYNKLVMVGDGATDLEARQPGGADIFICFAGVQFRALVAAESDWCVLAFQDLIDALDYPEG